MREHAKQQNRNALIEQKAAREAKLRTIRAKELQQKERNEMSEPLLKKRVMSPPSQKPSHLLTTT